MFPYNNKISGRKGEGNVSSGDWHHKVLVLDRNLLCFLQVLRMMQNLERFQVAKLNPLKEKLNDLHFSMNVSMQGPCVGLQSRTREHHA